MNPPRDHDRGADARRAGAPAAVLDAVQRHGDAAATHRRRSRLGAGGGLSRVDLRIWLLLALAYTLAGWLSLYVSLAPGYVAVVFPAAGIALAAMLRYGPSVWPGVYLGGLAVHALAAAPSGAGASALWLLPPAAATLQALAGHWLSRRLIGLPSALDTPQAIVRFLAVVAPLSCLVAPALSMPPLVHAGVIASGDAFANAAYWWIGDVLGVILAAPLALAFVGEPRALWRSRRVALGLSLLVMSTLTAGVFSALRASEELRVRERFEREAEYLANQVRRRLAVQVEILYATERFVALSLGFSRADFRDYAAPILARHPGTQNFTWNPLVLDGEREIFEAVVRFNDNLPQFAILDRDDASPRRTTTAARAAEYLPILYVEPLERNRTVLGLNPLSIPLSAPAIARTRSERRPIATEAFTLTQEESVQRGVVLYYAVFQRSGGDERFVGLVSSAFRMDDVLAVTVEEFDERELALCLVDVDAPPDNRRLSGPGGCESDDWMETALAIAIPVEFASRHWEVRVRAVPGSGAGPQSVLGWVVIVVGMLTAGALNAFLLIATGQARRAEGEIHQLAYYDALTGLANRRLWLQRAHAALSAARRHDDQLAVLFLDVDQFKTINDSLGHAAGDQLLSTVSRRLGECVREDDVLARLGGDEFVALLPRLERAEDAATVARKMLTVLSRPIDIDGHDFSVSVSIGIAVFPHDGADVDTLLKHADTAMYSVKEAGRNNFQFFIPAMNARALDRLKLESGLRRAIERNELELHYQPQFDSTGVTVVGAEALLRWQHPDMGTISPERFVPVAENCGLIVPLGEWVMRRAFAQQRIWACAGRSRLVVAVNVSALQFRKSDFVDSVQRLLRETGADPARIELEITESALMQPSDELFSQLDRLVGLGIRLALDDFGTGYSSLAYLKRLPIHRLKLDRSFVCDLPGDVEDAAIASAALSMARDLGIEVVAEGVETDAQREYLAARGCRIMQGYLFARPLPVAAFETQFPVVRTGADASVPQACGRDWPPSSP